MSLFKKRLHYKPFDYEWAFEAYDMQQKMHWLPSEVPLHEDVRDWNERLTGEEKSLISNILKFFTQGDVDIAQAYLDKYIPMFHPPEIRMMLTAFAASEANHAHSYSLLNDTIGEVQLTDYKAFQEYKVMMDKHNYLFEDKGKGMEGLARDIACFSAFGEGLQLFASFVMLLNFQRYGKMKGMCQIVTWSIRDETHHVENMIKLFHELVKENPNIWTEKFKASIYQACRDMVELEDKFIDLAFLMGGIRGLKPEEVKQYIRYIADRRLLQLSLKPNFKVKDNPLGWLDWVLNGVEHANFFENRATEYNKGTLTGKLWD
ncbi:ribonucleotide-diphosphate reductase subunit beta [Pelagibacter phage HTVC168P]|nr:ribonucleotide-diphosphate reductase subunit beta [Pelagibacter phage HTVC168P]